MKKHISLLLVSLSCLSLIACHGSDNSKVEVDSTIVFDFANESHDFVGLFSDYPQGEEAFYQLEAKHQQLPEQFGDKKGWMLAGNNHSDDLLMAIKGSVSGLRSQTLYSVSLELEFLTNVPSNCGGIGGSPGASVFVKLATSNVEPTNSLEDGYLRLNTDIGIQSQSGTEGVVVGDVANGIDCSQVSEFQAKVLATELPIDVMSDDQGKIWLLAATDSGFEGYTQIYITKLTATINQ